MSEFSFILNELSQRRSAELIRTAEGKTYKRRFEPAARLIILGGGHVSAALGNIASLLDFEITVVDDRPAFANFEQHPKADRIICDDFEKALGELNIGAGDYVCVLTRGHRYDAACVRYLMKNTMPYYLGMMGSKKRVAQFRSVLADEGFEKELTDKLHAPIGLAIGAASPAEIAVSICAELIAQKSAISSEGDCLKITGSSDDVLAALADDSVQRALLMILESVGSTPAKPGKIMCLKATGETFGTIGGGCSEASAVNKARQIIGTGSSAVIEVNLSGAEAEELGMVCGGSLLVYIEDVK